MSKDKKKHVSKVDAESYINPSKSAMIYTMDIADACRDYIRIFGANKNLYRIIPSMQDGLKPSARRFLYTMYKKASRGEFVKMASVAGDVIGSFHPHGNASVEDVGAGLASPIANNITLLEGKGNFGSYKSDEAGASRYITCRLSKFAYDCFFKDFEFSNVPMKEAFNGKDMEPEFLPSKYPVALFNPQLSGIGYGASSNIPGFNVTEVLEATIELIKNPKASIYLIPDSPTGADVIDDGQFAQINEEGVGTFTLRGTVEVDNIRNTITITSIPLQITIDQIIRNIIALRKKKIFEEIIDIKDYSNETEVKCILYLQNTANPYRTVENLFKKGTGMKKTYSVGITMIDDYEKYDYSIRSFLLEWIDYRRDIVISYYNTKLVKAEEEKNMNDILLYIFEESRAEDTLKIIRNSNSRQDTIHALMNTYKMNSQQAETIANMRFYNFNKESYEGYKQKKKDLNAEIKELEKILDHDEKIDEMIISQLKEGIEKWGSPRKSNVVKEESDEEKNIPKTDHLVGISKDGYIKKISLSEKQIGQVGNSTSQIIVLSVNNTENILIFDSNGKVFRIPVHSISNMKVKDQGVLLERYFSVNGKVVSVLIEPSEAELKKRGTELCFTFLTKLGYCKRTLLSEFTNVNGSTTAISIPSNDELVAAEFTSASTSKDMVIYTNRGNGIRRDINDLPLNHANARGVRQAKLPDDEWCVGFDKINPENKYMFYITSAGRAKITEMKYFPSMTRKDDIVTLINLENNESLVGIRSVSKKDRIIVYKKKSEPEIIELEDMKVSTRVAKADKIIKTPKGDYVLSFAVILSK